MNTEAETNNTITFESYRDFPGYVINLDRESWRYKEARQKLTALGFSNIAKWRATDYREEDVNREIVKLGATKLERFVNDAEIALVLSHYRVWSHFLAGNAPFCLVFEDDVVAVPDFKKYADFKDLSYDDVELLSFGGIFLDITDNNEQPSRISLDEAKQQQGNKSYLKNCSFWQSHAYLLSRAGAYRAIAGYPAWLSSAEYKYPQVDNYISSSRKIKSCLIANREVGDPRAYSLSKIIHPEYGELHQRVCGIFLQEQSYKSTIQHPQFV